VTRQVVFDAQRALHHSLLSGQDDCSAIATGGVGRARRLAIYRLNFLHAQTGALRDIFPVVHALVGDAFFAELARCYALEVGSKSGDLNDFGCVFGAYVDAYPYAADLPYLGDVARLEWACHTAFHAADRAPTPLADFAAQLSAHSPEGLAAIRLELGPSVAWVNSSFPIASIWAMHQADAAGNGLQEVDLSAPECALVYRDELEVAVRAVDGVHVAFLDAVARGETISEALAAMVAASPSAESNLQGLLASLVQSGVIHLSPKEYS
jgi:hypothetical protein